VKAALQRWRQSRAVKLLGRTLTVVALLWASVISAPCLLAFPYHAQIGDKSVYSETPIAPDIAPVPPPAPLRNSAIFSDGYGKTIYLTDGGWRWRLLSVPGSANAFAFSRAFTETIVMNRSDVIADKVFGRGTDGRTRTLSDTIAHEQAHGLLRSRFGLSTFLAPQWKVEGYCDYVAQASSLNDAQAAALERVNPDHPALVYYHGRRRVAEILRANGGSVDRLFRD
jgi:hypothetical protein